MHRCGSLATIGERYFSGCDVLSFGETLLDIAPIEDHFLQLAFAAAVADRTIERVIDEQKFAHRTLRFFDLGTRGRDDHSVSAGDRARRLQLRHLVDAHQTHAARRLHLEVLVITKRRNAVSVFAAHVDQRRALFGLDLDAVYRDLDRFCSPSAIRLFFFRVVFFGAVSVVTACDGTFFFFAF